MNLLDNSYGHRYISFYVPPGKLCSVLGGISMRQFVFRVFPERKSSGRSSCGFITLKNDPNMIDVHKIAIADMDKNGTQDIIVAEQDQIASAAGHFR